mmetsp:Transcript_91982/g.173293  ORF Transcript_91982/g.173293 Transcript_91982/m.173293 type:complete len:1270 (-) Transcript_91982:49-3858(-)
MDPMHGARRCRAYIFLSCVLACVPSVFGDFNASRDGCESDLAICDDSNHVSFIQKMSRDSRAFPTLSQKRRVSLIGTADARSSAHIEVEAREAAARGIASTRIGLDCWFHCDNHGGYCSWCGEGNACCRQGFDADPSECKRGHGFSAWLDRHQCVALEPQTPAVEVAPPRVAAALQQWGEAAAQAPTVNASQTQVAANESDSKAPALVAASAALTEAPAAVASQVENLSSKVDAADARMQDHELRIKALEMKIADSAATSKAEEFQRALDAGIIKSDHLSEESLKDAQSLWPQVFGSLPEEEKPKNGSALLSEALHTAEDCWYQCGSRSGYCSWCGEGNACCRSGFGKDPGECKRAQGLIVGRTTHQCVTLAPEADMETHPESASVSLSASGNVSPPSVPADALIYEDSIEAFLAKELKGKHFRYVVNVGNSGDALIQYGTLLLFDKLGLDYEIVQPIDLQRGQLLVYAGAGNLVEGMNYKECSFFLELNAKKAAGNTIILLPATIRGFDEQLRGLGSNVIIFTREKDSYEHVKKTVSDQVRVFLSKDMAFYINDLDPELARIKRDSQSKRKENIGLVLRTDQENPDNTYIPPYNRDLSAIGKVQFDRKDPAQNQETVKRSIVKVAHNFLDRVGTYSQVWTNRLHVCIAGAIMNLDKVHCMDTKNRKVKDVFDYSIAKQFLNTRWAGNVTNQPWVHAITLDPPTGAWMCLASVPGLNTSWCVDAEPRDGYEFMYNGGDTKICGDCSCCYRRQGLPQSSADCYDAGNSVALRDAACAGDLACARRGYDGRDYGDCPSQHCCSEVPHLARSRLSLLSMPTDKFSALSVSAVVRKKIQAGYRNLPPSSLKPAEAMRYVNIGVISMLVIRLLRWKVGGDTLERLTFFLDLVVWYVGTAIYLSTSQKLLETCDSASIITIAFVQVFSGTTLIPITDTAKVTRFSRHLLTILACGGCAFYFGVYFSLHAQARTGILFTSNVRALEPFFTTFLMALLAGESLTPHQYAGIVVAVSGVILAATEFSITGVQAAMSGQVVLTGWMNFMLLSAANLVYSTRNIIFHQTAQLAKNVLPSPITLFMVSALLSFPFAGLLFFFINFPAPVADITSQLVGFDAELLLISSAAFVLYNVASFFILMRVTPTEHAVLLTGKRIATVIFACALSGQLPSLKQVASLTITAGGVATFELEKRRRKSPPESETKQPAEIKPEPVLDLAEQYLADLAQDEVLDLPDPSEETTKEKLTHIKRILLSRVGAPIFLVLFTTVCMGIPAAMAL